MTALSKFIYRFDLHQSRLVGIRDLFIAAKTWCRRMWQAERRQRIVASVAQMLTKTIVACVLTASAMTGTALACQKEPLSSGIRGRESARHAQLNSCSHRVC